MIVLRCPLDEAVRGEHLPAAVADEWLELEPLAVWITSLCVQIQKHALVPFKLIFFSLTPPKLIENCYLQIRHNSFIFHTPCS